MKVLFYVCLAMIAFAANSIFTRLALSTTEIDAITFSTLRLLFAALVVLLILPRDRSAQVEPTRLRSFFLVAYAIPFTYAYTVLSASLGALILFSVVQVSMIGFAVLFKNEKLNLLQCFGFGLAVTGILMLFAPSARPPDSYIPVFVMIVAGLAWAGFSVVNTKTPLSLVGVRQIFKQASVLAIILYGITLTKVTPTITIDGLVYAFLCGALTTGLGYCLWYLMLNRITSITAAVAQLSVPVISMFLGVTLLDEHISTVELSSACLALLGIAIYILSKYLSSLTTEKTT